MRIDVIHELIGYDPNTRRVVYREEISSLYMEKVLYMVAPDADDPDAIDSYVVDLHVANEIAVIAGLPEGPHNAEFFVESLAQV